MPKSKVSNKKLFRDFSYIDKKFIKYNYLKNLKTCFKQVQEERGITQNTMMMLLFCYDLEFFTGSYLAKEFNMVENKLKDNFIYPMVNEGYIYKHFDKLTPSSTIVEHLFREENKWNYRIRYALTQKGRMFVAYFYRRLEGDTSSLVD